MTHNQFEYIFIQKSIAQVNQPIEVFTNSGKLIIGEYISCYSDLKNNNSEGEAIEIAILYGEYIFMKREDILQLKLTFINKRPYDNYTFGYSDMKEFLSINNRIEIVFNDKKVVNGFVQSYFDVEGNW